MSLVEYAATSNLHLILFYFHNLMYFSVKLDFQREKKNTAESGITYNNGITWGGGLN